MKAVVFLALSLLIPFSSFAQWMRVNALPAGDVGSVLVQGATVYAGTDSAIYISVDGGTNWTRSATIPNSPMLVDAIGVFDGKLFAGTGGNGVYVSSNNGQSWQALNTGLSGAGLWASSFAQRGNSFYMSTMGGGVFSLQQNSWTQVGDLPNQQAGNVYSLLVKADTLFAAAGGNGYVWILPPNAATWRGVQIAPFVGQAHIINFLTLWNGAILAGGSYGVYRSFDNAETWEFSGYGLTVNNNVHFAALGTTLYSSFSTVNTRIYRTGNGRDWELVETLPFTYSIAASATKLFAARLDGLWFNSSPATPVEEEPSVPESIALNQNFPNPFNPETTITYSLTVPGSVRLEVLDLLGRTVATLVNETRDAGTHSVRWDASQSAGGIYFYRLAVAGNSLSDQEMTIVRKMMLVR